MAAVGFDNNFGLLALPMDWAREIEGFFTMLKSRNGGERGFRREFFGSVKGEAVAFRDLPDNKPGKPNIRVPLGGLGFTLIEILVTIMVLGIILTIAGVSYARGRRIYSLKSGAEEVRAALERCYNIALQEGVDVYAVFYGEEGDHPNTYAIYRGLQERENDSPTERPNAGSSYQTDGFGHYWFKLADGAVAIGETVEFLFQRNGTVVVVSPVPEDSGMSVTVKYGDEARVVTISRTGSVSIQ